MNHRKELARALVRGGYRIIPVAAASKHPTMFRWPEHRATEAGVAQWSDDGSIGVLAGTTPAVDLDIQDEDMAQEMEAWVKTRYGDAPVRIGNAPKRLLVFAATEGGMRKRASARYTCPAGRSHQVEVLGGGQQFVAYGVHPSTKKPYQWVSDLALHEIDTMDLPVLREADAEAILREFERRAEDRGWAAHRVAEQNDAKPEPGGLDFLRPKPAIRTEDVVAAVAALPNPGRDFDLWLKVGAALHSHFDGGAEGAKLWHEWSARSPLHDASEVERRYASFGRYGGRPVTAASLLPAGGKLTDRGAGADRKAEYRRLAEAVEACTELDELMTSLAERVGKADLEAYHAETLVNALHARAKKLGHKLSIQSVRSAVAGAPQKTGSVGSSLSLERDLAQQVLDAYFAGGKHLKRFSKMWWSYRAGRWTRADDEMVEKAVMDTLLALDPDDSAVAYLSAQVGESRGDRLSALVAAVAKALGLLCAEEGGDDPLNLLSFDVPRVMNFRNGELWFDPQGNTAFRPHRPESHLTFRLECEYDPEATAPTWEAALARVTCACAAPSEVTALIHEIYGYLAQPTRDCAAWVLFKGPGGNGKSFIADVMATLFGRDTVLARSVAEIAGGAGAHFGEALVGKNMLLDDDYKAGVLLPDDWLKKLSEAKLVTANPKFARTFEFKARAVPVLLANHWPPTTDLSEGLRRRAVVIETNHVLRDDEKDPAHRRTVVQQELSGVANLLIAGFARFLRRGAKFALPAECEVSRQRWLQASNTTALFVGTVLERVEAGNVKGAALYDTYRQWLAANEHNAKELGRSRFYDALEKLGVERGYPGGVCTFYRVKVRDQVEGVDFF